MVRKLTESKVWVKEHHEYVPVNVRLSRRLSYSKRSHMGSYDKDAIVRKLTNRVREKACLEVPNDYNPDDLILTTLLVLPPDVYDTILAISKQLGYSIDVVIDIMLKQK